MLQKFKILSLIAIILMLFSPISATSTNRGTYIPNNENGIPDLALYEFIKNQTKKEDVFSNDLLDIASIKLSNKLYSIRSLKGLSLLNMPALKTLELDISTLSSLEDVLPLGTLRELKITSSALIALPEDINRLENLSILSISGSQITKLPAKLFEMLTLNTLSLDSVPLIELPKEISNLKHLEVLEINDMNIDIIEEVYNLNLLKVLVLNNMNIEKISESINKFELLETLDLSSNKIKEIPDFLYTKNSLQTLLLKNNNISVLSEKIEYLTRLKSLDLSNNVLVDLPIQLANLSQLKVLNIANNKFTCLPSELGLLKLDSVYDFFKYNDVEKCGVVDEIDDLVKMELKFSDPTMTLNATTNKDVTLVSNIEVFFIVNGIQEDEMHSEITLQDEGNYAISAMRESEGTTESVKFTIDKTSPVIKVQGDDMKKDGYEVEIAIESNEDGTYYVNGTENNNDAQLLILSENNDYEVYQMDASGNKSNVLAFYISKPATEITDKPMKKKVSIFEYFIYAMGVGVASFFIYKFLKKGAQLERED